MHIDTIGNVIWQENIFPPRGLCLYGILCSVKFSEALPTLIKYFHTGTREFLSKNPCLFPERFFSQRKLDFNGFLGGGGGAPVWGYYFRQHQLSFHPICLYGPGHSNAWLCTLTGCLEHDSRRPAQLAVLWVNRQHAVS